ncbi:hypothetical protein ACFL1U_02960 [Patescibacteria group bacterium]
MDNLTPNPTPNIPEPQAAAPDAPPAAYDVPEVGAPAEQIPAPQPSVAPIPIAQPVAAPVAPPAPSRRLPSPIWFWYGLSGLTWIVGVVLAVIYISRRDKASKRFGWFSLLWSFLFLAIVAALILFNYYVLDTVG